MICEKCGNEMNTVYQHELQNISEKHLKYIALLGAIPFGFVVIWIWKHLCNKKDIPTYTCPNCGNEFTMDPHVRRRELTQSNAMRILGSIAAIIFTAVLVCNVPPSVKRAKLEFHREVERMAIVTEEINIRVGEKEKIKLFTDTPEIYSFKSANETIATVNKKNVVKGKKAGSTTIKMYKNRTEYIGSIDVTVKNKKTKGGKKE